MKKKNLKIFNDFCSGPLQVQNCKSYIAKQFPIDYSLEYLAFAAPSLMTTLLTCPPSF